MIPHEPHRWQHPDTILDDLIVRLNDGLDFDHSTIKSLIGAHGATYSRTVGEHAHSLAVAPGDSEALAKALLASGLVQYAQPNVMRYRSAIPNDPNFSSQSIPNNIDCPGAWNITTGYPSVVVALFDADGIDPTISELSGKVVLPGYNTGNQGSDTSLNAGPVSTTSHMTAGAGFIAAVTNNGAGMAAVGYNTSIIPIKMSAFSDAQITDGLRWVRTNQAARICNMSFSGAGAPLQSTIDEVAACWAANIMVVAAAGQGASSGTATPQYPGAIAHVIAVANCNAAGRKDSKSNYGSWVTIACPGQDWSILSDGSFLVGAADAPLFPHLVSGTSFSAPVVSAVIALMLAINPSLAAPEVVRLLQANSKPTISGSGAGGGTDFQNPPLPAYLINAHMAVRAAATLAPVTRRVPRSHVQIHGSY